MCATKVLTVTKCDVPGCKHEDDVEGSFGDRIPDKWFTITVNDAKRIVCPAHGIAVMSVLRVLAPVKTRKKRKDAGIPKGKKPETEVGVNDLPQTLVDFKGYNVPLPSSKNNLLGPPQPSERHRKVKDKEIIGPTPEQAAEHRARHGVVCPSDCPHSRVTCTKEDTAAITCIRIGA